MVYQGKKAMEVSVAEASSMFPGFRFSPTDKDLVQFYLSKKIQGCDEVVDVIAEVDICRHEPWDLPAQAAIPSNDEWFFFSPRGRKYTNGSQCNRATELGYWKATGKERNIKLGTNHVIGRKRTLVFHIGRAPKGVRTEWILYQYCSAKKSEDGMVVCRLKKNKGFHSKDEIDNNNNTTTLLSGGYEQSQTGMSEGKPDDTGSRGFFSGSGPCDKKMSGSEFSHHESSRFKKSCTGEREEEVVEEEEEEEDDCYADIMKDDIIKLDDDDEDDCYADIMKDDIIKLDDVKDYGPVIKLMKSEMKKNITTTRPGKQCAMQRFQGMAHRRVRLRGQKLQGPDLLSHQQRSLVEKMKYPSIFVLVLVLVLFISAFVCSACLCL